MKSLFAALILFCVLLCPRIAEAQTSVSGGIYADTTWTKANSPYLVTGSVTVFPGVTLTIEAGVVVKLADGKSIEIRQGSLIANGTGVDSIVFTSNAPIPHPGSWGSIFLNGGSMPISFTHCRFHYAHAAVICNSASPLTIRRCLFSHNEAGMTDSTFIPAGGATLIDSTVFESNTQFGTDLIKYGGDTSVSILMNHCRFANNDVGFQGFSGRPTRRYRTAIRNCLFQANRIGAGYTSSAWIDSCRFTRNALGSFHTDGDSITNCLVDSNTIWGLFCFGSYINHCKIRYNDVGIMLGISTIVNSTIENNRLNIHNEFYSPVAPSVIMMDTIRNGAVGIDSVREHMIITKNVIENNGIGIILKTSDAVITCNKICGNIAYDLRLATNTNLTVANNYWCVDSATLRSRIYDGYVNATYGLVSYMPFDSTCYLASSVGVAASTPSDPIKVYPNPARDYLNIQSPVSGTVSIFDLLGRQVLTSPVKAGRDMLDIGLLPPGIFILDFSAGNSRLRQRFVKE